MLLKIATFLIVGSMLVMITRLLSAQIEASKARAKVAARSRRKNEVTRLRRDPATGIYYPEP